MFVHFYWIYCCVAAHKIAKWCVSIHLSCLVHSSVIYSMCSGLCFSHSLCMAVLQAACVLGCEVWVFVAFAVSKTLSVSLCPNVCVCCSVLHRRTDLADITFPLIYTQCTHVHTHSSLRIFCFTHTYNAGLLFEMPPDTEISTSTASNAWPHLKIGMQSSSQQQYKDAGIKRGRKSEWKWIERWRKERQRIKANTNESESESVQEIKKDRKIK